MQIVSILRNAGGAYHMESYDGVLEDPEGERICMEELTVVCGTKPLYCSRFFLLTPLTVLIFNTGCDSPMSRRHFPNHPPLESKHQSVGRLEWGCIEVVLVRKASSTRNPTTAQN